MLVLELVLLIVRRGRGLGLGTGHLDSRALGDSASRSARLCRSTISECRANASISFEKEKEKEKEREKALEIGRTGVVVFTVEILSRSQTRRLVILSLLIIILGCQCQLMWF